MMLSKQTISSYKLDTDRKLVFNLFNSSVEIDLDKLDRLNYSYEIITEAGPGGFKFICPDCGSFSSRKRVKFQSNNLTKNAGIYILLNRVDYPIYIGQASRGNRKSRIREHLSGFGECVKDILVFDCSYRVKVEAQCIRYWKPILNIQGKPQSSLENYSVKKPTIFETKAVSYGKDTYAKENIKTDTDTDIVKSILIKRHSTNNNIHLVLKNELGLQRGTNFAARLSSYFYRFKIKSVQQLLTEHSVSRLLSTSGIGVGTIKKLQKVLEYKGFKNLQD